MASSPPSAWGAVLGPEFYEHGEPEEELTMLVWRFPQPLLAVSSAPLGGGLGRREWVVNVQVPDAYARLDPETHLGELASACGLKGPGVGMLTAVDLRDVCSEEDNGVRVDVSVGVTVPTWAAAPDEEVDDALSAPGTINVVAIVPEHLSPRRADQRRRHRHRGQGPGSVGLRDRRHRHGVGRGVHRLSRRRCGPSLRRPTLAMGLALGPRRVPRRRDGLWISRRVVITLVLGGARSGKSAVAEALAAGLAGPLTYIATLEVGDDADLAARVERHKARRPGEWRTVEAGNGLPELLHATAGSVLVDSLGPWVSAAPGMNVDVEALCSALVRRAGDTVVVSEEVGMSVHPPTEEGRRFCDALGTLNQAVAARADDVILVVAGTTIHLEQPSTR